MTIATIAARADGIVQSASGNGAGAGAAVTINLGFNPLEVTVVNSTDATIWKKIAGMAAADSVKTVTAGTTTVDTGSAILFNGDGTITLSATLAANGKAIAWVARR